MDTCSRCDKPAKYYRREGDNLSFTCDEPGHMRAQSGLSSEWKGVKTLGGAALAEAKKGATITKKPPPQQRPT
jgi:hypothetical protein